MILFPLAFLLFSTSFLVFKQKKFFVSELLFISAGLLFGYILKHKIDISFRLLLYLSTGFFGLLYGISIDIRRLSSTSTRLFAPFLEFTVIFLVILIILKAFSIHYPTSFYFALFSTISASPYIFLSRKYDKRALMHSYIQPIFVFMLLPFLNINLYNMITGSIIFLLIILYLYFIARANVSYSAISQIAGLCIIAPTIGFKLKISPLFLSFLIGIVISNNHIFLNIKKKSLALMNVEKMFYLVFLFMLSYLMSFNFLIPVIVVVAVRLILKILSARTFYPKSNVMTFVPQGGIALSLLGDYYIMYNNTSLFFAGMFMAVLSIIMYIGSTAK